MPICKHCGVEIEADLPYCPLCRSSIYGEDPVGEPNIRTPLPETAAHQKGWFWGLISLLGLGGGAIVSAVDLAYGMSITWSRYPLISIAYLWLTVSLFIYLRKHIYFLLLFETINLGLYLWILNLFTPITPWVFSLVIPLYILVSVFIGLTLVIVRKFRLALTGIVVTGMINMGLFLLLLEMILNRFIFDIIFISWSLIIFACFLTLSAALLFIQKRYGLHRSELKKQFHT